MNGWRNEQIDEQMDDVVKCEKQSFMSTFNVEKPTNCGSSWNDYESWWMKWCEIEWNIVYGSEEFCHIAMSFRA